MNLSRILKEGTIRRSESFSTPLSLRTLRTTSDDLMGIVVPFGFWVFQWPRDAAREEAGARLFCDIVKDGYARRMESIKIIQTSYEGGDETRVCLPYDNFNSALVAMNFCEREAKHVG